MGALIRDDRNRVYVHRRSASRRLLPGTWDVVGGHVEAGETPQQALARDIAARAVRTRLTSRLRLEPIGRRHAGDLWRLHQDEAVAPWYDGRCIVYLGKPEVLYELDRA